MPSDTPQHSALSRAVRATAGMTLLSRLGGLARDILIGRIFGDTLVGSAFAAAFAIPNMFRRLFGEGALSAAFIPAYAQAERQSHEQANQLASLTLAALGVVTSALTILIELVLLAVLLLAPGDAERTLSLRLIMVMLPFMPLICTAAILAGMLQIHGRYGPASSGPLILNTFIVAVGVYSLFSGQLAGPAIAYLIGIATVLSGFTQSFWFARLLRPHFRFTRHWTDARGRASEMLRKFVPVAIGLGTLQLNAFVDVLIAMFPIWFGPTLLGAAYPLDGQSNIVMSLTQRLYQFPLGVFGIAIATAVFPLLARQAHLPGDFMQTLRRGLRLSLFIGLPASIGLVLVRFDLTSVMFENFGTHKHGFSPEGTLRAAAVLLGFAPGVWAYSLNHVLTRAFYARGDTTTPMKIGLCMVALNLCLNLSLIWPLREAGLAWATSISAMVQCVVLAEVLKKSLLAEAATQHSADVPTTLIDRATAGGMARIALLGLIMAAAVAALLWFWPQPPTWSGRAARLAAATSMGIVTYLAAARIAGSPELRWLLSRPAAAPSPGTGATPPPMD